MIDEGEMMEKTLPSFSFLGSGAQISQTSGWPEGRGRGPSLRQVQVIFVDKIWTFYEKTGSANINLGGINTNIQELNITVCNIVTSSIQILRVSFWIATRWHTLHGVWFWWRLVRCRWLHVGFNDCGMPSGLCGYFGGCIEKSQMHQEKPCIKKIKNCKESTTGRREERKEQEEREEGMQKGREGKGREGKGREGKGREGKGRERKGKEGKGRERKGKEGKGRERKGKEGKGRERKGKEGKGRERKGKEGKGRERKGKEGKGREKKGKEGKGRERKGKERKGRERKGKEGKRKESKGKEGKGRERKEER